MTKFLLVLVVFGVLLWLLLRRRRDAERVPDPAAPVTMLACSHCGLHLPQAEATFDADGRPYCGEAHRLAGPRRGG